MASKRIFAVSLLLVVSSFSSVAGSPLMIFEYPCAKHQIGSERIECEKRHQEKSKLLDEHVGHKGKIGAKKGKDLCYRSVSTGEWMCPN